MAVFLINICKFNGCGITFSSLSDLISHIEDTHIDYDPKVVEQKEQDQPACLPLSYVLRFIPDDARKESPYLVANAAGVELKRKLAIKHHSYSMSSSNRSNTPTGSEIDEDEMVVTESEDSNDSWTTEEFSSEFIMRYGSRHSGGGANGTPGNEKPFACPVPGCKKRYKNVNGIKYHSKNGHKKDGKVRKGFKCHCGKSYKTAQGLKNHALLTHNTQPDSVLTTQQVANVNAVSVTAAGGVLLQRSGSPSQSLGSLSPSSMSNMSSSASSCHGGSTGSNISVTANATAINNNNLNIATSNVININNNGNNNNNNNNNSNNNNTNNNNNVLQPFTNAIVTVAPTNGQQNQTVTTTLQQQQAQQQQHTQIVSQTTTATAITTGNHINNSNNNINSFMRGTLGLVTIKTNHNHNASIAATPTTTAATASSSSSTNMKTAAATNLLAANVAASKILKLATNVANGNATNIVDIVQQHKIVDNRQQQQSQANTNSTPTKIALPNLVNLGILTPAASPTKNTQTLTFSAQQQQQQQQQQQPLQQQQSQQQHNLPMTPISPKSSGSSSNSNSPIPQQTQSQLQHQQNKVVGITTLSPKQVTSSTTTTTTTTITQPTPSFQVKKQNVIANIQLTANLSAVTVVGVAATTTTTATNTVAATTQQQQQQKPQIVSMDECSFGATVSDMLCDSNSDSCAATIGNTVMVTEAITSGTITDQT